MKILIADDDTDDLSMASETLLHLNSSIEIETVKDGQELITNLSKAVELKKQLPNLVLLDLNMPRKDGRTALKEIKATPSLKNINVIIFSTSKSDEDRKLALALGAQKYIVKPSDYGILLEVFKSISNQLVDAE